MRHTETVGATIAAWRRQAGLSQAALAKIIGINRVTLAKIERGQPTSSDTLIALCAALKQPVGDVLQEDSRKNLIAAVIGS